MYYNYHGIIQKQINEGRLKKFYFVDNYKKMGKILMLCFENKQYPIREKWFAYYSDLISKKYQITSKFDFFYKNFTHT